MDTDVICMLVMLSAVLTPSAALPVKYDQRQDGELNVHAHLENFVIVLIPNNGGLGLLDFIPLKKDVNRGAKPASSGSDSEKYVPPSTAIKSSSPDFPAGKSPYKVDIDKKPDSHTSNAGDEKSPASGEEEEVVIAHSPPVLLSKTPAKKESESPQTTSSAGETSSKPSVEVFTDNAKKEDPIASSEKADATLTKTDGNDYKKDDVPAVDSVPEKSVKSPKSIDFVVEVPLTGVKKATEEDIPVIDFSPKSVKSPNLPAFRSESSDSEELANKLKQLRSGLEECAPGQRRDRLGNCHHSKSRSGQFFAPESLLPALQFGLSPAID